MYLRSQVWHTGNRVTLRKIFNIPIKTLIEWLHPIHLDLYVNNILLDKNHKRGNNIFSPYYFQIFNLFPKDETIPTFDMVNVHTRNIH